MGKKRPLWLQTDVGGYWEAQCQEQCVKGGSVAREKGCDKDRAVLYGPHHPDPLVC